MQDILPVEKEFSSGMDVILPHPWRSVLIVTGILYQGILQSDSKGQTIKIRAIPFFLTVHLIVMMIMTMKIGMVKENKVITSMAGLYKYDKS